MGGGRNPFLLNALLVSLCLFFIPVQMSDLFYFLFFFLSVGAEAENDVTPFPRFTSVVSPRLPLPQPDSLDLVKLSLSFALETIAPIVPSFKCDIFSFTSSVSVIPYPLSFYLRDPVVFDHKSILKCLI